MPSDPKVLRKIASGYRNSSYHRAAARELLGSDETRGRKQELAGEAMASFHVELEARARLLADGKLSRLLRNSKLRLIDTLDTNHRLSKQDRERLRKHYQIGEVESRAVHRRGLQYGQPGNAPRPRNDSKYEREIERRMNELRKDNSELFFLKIV